MRKFRALVVLNLRAMLTSFHVGGRKKNRAATGVGAMVFLAALGVYISGVYSFTFASQLASVGMVRLTVLLVSVLAVAMGLVFTAFAAQGVVFGGKDNDLMLSLPVSAFSLMLARTLALYAENLVFTLFVMLPAGAAYLVYGGAGGAAFLLVLLLCSVLLALLPTLLALLVGFVIAWASSKFTRRSLLTTLLYLASFVALMAGLMRLNFAMADLTRYAMGLQDAFSGWGLPFILMMEASCQGDLPALLGFAAFCVVPFFVAVRLFALRYKKIVTGLTARGARSDYRLGKVSASGCRRALLKKEARKFFGTPIYLMNAGMGLVLLLAAGAAAVIFKGKLAALLAQLGPALDGLPVAAVLTASICVLVSMTAITASSISLEGKQLWIIKSAPVSAKGIFLVKAGFHLLLVAPVVIISSACFTFAFSLRAADGLLMLLAGLSVGLCTALLGLFANLCLPKLDAPNDMVVVKQSAAAMIGMFGSMLLVLLGCGLYALLQGVTGGGPAILAVSALFLAGAALFWALLSKKGPKLFSEL